MLQKCICLMFSEKMLMWQQMCQVATYLKFAIAFSFDGAIYLPTSIGSIE